jgi:hypothetical protein
LTEADMNKITDLPGSFSTTGANDNMEFDEEKSYTLLDP